MFRSIPRPSAAMVIACLALAVALSGTSYAQILNAPVNSVGTAQLKANAVISSKVKNHSLLAADFKPGQLPGVSGYEVVEGGPSIVMNHRGRYALQRRQRLAGTDGARHVGILGPGRSRDLRQCVLSRRLPDERAH